MGRGWGQAPAQTSNWHKDTAVKQKNAINYFLCYHNNNYAVYMIGNREARGGREGERGGWGVGGRYSLLWDVTYNTHRDATDNCHRYAQCTHMHTYTHSSSQYANITFSYQK